MEGHKSDTRSTPKTQSHESQNTSQNSKSKLFAQTQNCSKLVQSQNTFSFFSAQSQNRLVVNLNHP